MKTIKRNLNRRQASAAASAQEDFVNSTGSFKGVSQPFTIVRGWLNDEEYATLCAHVDIGISYVVYSYDTPIAWVLSNGVRYRVSQKFSRTTSCHMGLTWRSDLDKVEA